MGTRDFDFQQLREEYKKTNDDILKPVEIVLKTGGYIPFGDHFIPPEVSWQNFKYYRNRLNEIIEAK